MKIIIKESEKDFYRASALQVASQLDKKPESVIGLALGTTTLGVHQEMARMSREGEIDFARCAMFIVDETVGTPREHPSTGYSRIHKQLFDQINIKRENTFTPDTMAADPERECTEYEKKILGFGGIDLQMLGIGANGHIGFNEPNVPFETLTHVVKISDLARHNKLPFFSRLDEVPEYGITLGIKSIMMAKNVLLMAKGREKADIILKTLFGPVTPAVPASVLQLHRHLTVVLDAASAEKIQLQANI